MKFLSLFILFLLWGTGLMAAQPRMSDLIGFGTSAVINATVVDTAGNIYIAGDVTGELAKLPVNLRIQPSRGSRDVFAAKLNRFGAVTFVAVIGGSSQDFSRAIAVDTEGAIYVAGSSLSRDFPTTPGAFSMTLATDGPGAFVFRLSADGTRLIYSTGLGGASSTASRLVVDSRGNAYVGGSADVYGGAASVPATAAAWPVPVSAIGGSAYVAKLGPAGSTLEFCSIIGGDGITEALALALSPNEELWLAGRTTSRDLPSAGSFLGRSLFRSRDGAQTWTEQADGGRLYNLWQHPSRPGHLYASAEGGRLRVTKDFGQTWESRVLAEVAFDFELVRRVAFAPSEPDVLYASVDGQGIFKSDDGGNSWSLRGKFLNRADWLGVDPDDSNKISVSWADFTSYSADGGVTWRYADPIPEFFPLTINVALIAITPGPPATYWGTIGPERSVAYGGLYRSRDGGKTWKRQDGDLDTGTLVTIVQHRSNPQLLLGGGPRTFPYRSDDGGETWKKIDSVTTVSSFMTDPESPDRVYAAGPSGVFTSDDFGSTWRPSNSGLTNTSGIAVAIDLSQPSHLLALSTSSDDGFVMRLSADGKAVEYASYAGGAASDVINAITFDEGGMLWAVGTTSSPNVAVTADAVQRELAGRSDGIVTKVDPSTGAVLYSTYFGGAGLDELTAVVPYRQQSIMAAGGSENQAFPTTADGIDLGERAGVAISLARFELSGATVFSSLLPKGFGSVPVMATLPYGPVLLGGFGLGAPLTMVDFSPACPVSLSADEIAFSAASGTGTIAVAAAADCVWNATTTASWIEVTTGAVGMGVLDVRFSVASNSGATSRTGTVQVGDQRVTITQAGGGN